MKKTIVISGLLILSSIIFFNIINNRTNSQNQNRINLSWNNTRKDKLSAITVSMNTNNSTTYFTISKNQGTWNITHPIDINVKTENAILLVNSFLTLTPNQKVSNIFPDQYKEYGLEKPNFIITGILDNKSNGFIIGDQTSIGNQYYIADINDTNNIYVVDFSSIEPFTKGVAYIINNQFLTQPIEEIISIVFKNNNNKNTLILTNIESFWQQISPNTNANVDWGTRKFLLEVKNIDFYAESVNLEVSDSLLKSLEINQETSPMLSITLRNQDVLELYIGTLTSKNNYPIYIKNKNMTAYSSKETIDNVFNISDVDFITKNSQS